MTNEQTETPQEQALKMYLLGEPADVTALRSNEMPQFPWPSYNHPMLGYLLKQATASVDTDGLEAALAWLAAHAWYEGTLAGLAERSDELPEFDRERVFTIMRQLGVSEQSALQQEEKVRRTFVQERRRVTTEEENDERHR